MRQLKKELLQISARLIQIANELERKTKKKKEKQPDNVIDLKKRDKLCAFIGANVGGHIETFSNFAQTIEKFIG